MRNSEARPKSPRSKKASAWRVYYERMASWYADHAINLAGEYPRASAHAQAEAWRFLEGACELRAGKHQNQVSGVWV